MRFSQFDLLYLAFISFVFEFCFHLPNYRYEGFIDVHLERLESNHLEVKLNAIRMLGVIEPNANEAAKVIDVIAGFIESKNDKERSAALRAIGDIGGKHAERYQPPHRETTRRQEDAGHEHNLHDRRSRSSKTHSSLHRKDVKQSGLYLFNHVLVR